MIIKVTKTQREVEKYEVIFPAFYIVVEKNSEEVYYLKDENTMFVIIIDRGTYCPGPRIFTNNGKDLRRMFHNFKDNPINRNEFDQFMKRFNDYVNELTRL